MGSTKVDDAAVQVAEAIVAASPEHSLAQYATALTDGNKLSIAKATRVFDELTTRKPELLSPYIESMVRLLTAEHARVVQTCATALPELARVAPAKVAKHQAKLAQAFDRGSDVAKDGVVRTYAALCIASVAYQRRLIEVLVAALNAADASVLARWTEVILPALKGEPHAQARAVVESRLYSVPRPVAVKIAAFLGIKLRPAAAR